YKDIGLQGLVYAKPDSPYMDLIGDIAAKKRRLGVDSWGGSDVNVREALDPLDALFDREFPGFAPWPWGRQPHIAVLVRHILMAEPLALQFGDLFAGVSASQARDLAASFRFDQCAERTGLSQVLLRHLQG